MRFKQNVQDVLNKQINAEFWSAYLYLAMSSYLEQQGLSGFANWMRVQYQEEVSHALKIFDYVISRGGNAKLEPIDAVKTEWNNVKEVFDETYEHECKVTDMIYDCYKVAKQEGDLATASMLQWFVDEQAEEEESALEMLDKLNLVLNDGTGMYLLDKELAKREFVDETLED